MKHQAFKLGSPTWARTRDLRINSPALYRLSYRGTEARIIGNGRVFVKVESGFYWFSAFVSLAQAFTTWAIARAT